MNAINIETRRFASYFQRLRGLIGRPPLDAGEGVHIIPCRQVHTLAMAYAIDVVHLDRDHVVLRVETLRPWRLGTYVRAAVGVVEMRAGEAERIGLQVGDRLNLIPAKPSC